MSWLQVVNSEEQLTKNMISKHQKLVREFRRNELVT